MCLLDAGRLMSAPLDAAQRPRLDAAVDAVTMVALVADELGDRCGVTVFDAEIRRRLAPRRNGGTAVVRTILDVEPTRVDSDHDLAFRSVGGGKRALDPRVHRSRRRSRGPLARRRGAGARPAGTRSSSRRCAIPTSTRRSRANRRARARRVRGRGRARRARRAHASRVAPAARGRAAWSRRPRRRLGEACVARLPPAQGTGAVCDGASAARGAPRQNTRPQYDARRGRSRRSSTTVRALCPAGVRKPSTRPATTSHAAVPSTISTAARASCAQRLAARSRCPDRRSPTPSRSPAAPATTMQLSSSTPCAMTSSKNGRPLPAPIASPADRAEQDAVLRSARRACRGRAAAAREREERHRGCCS